MTAGAWSWRSTRGGVWPMLAVMSSRRRATRVAVPRLQENVETSVILALFDLANHLQRYGERLAGEAGLTTQQWLVLLQIAGDPNFPARARDDDQPVLASDIARVRGLSRATISAVVGALVKRGFVREEPDPIDRRRRHLAITAAGSKALEAIEPARGRVNQRLLGELDVGERRRLLRSLHSCLAVLWDVREIEQLEATRARLAGRRRTRSRAPA